MRRAGVLFQRRQTADGASADGRLTPDVLRALATSRSDIHFPKPRVVSITQATETGLVYSVEELRALAAVCRELGLKLHMDGARFANACAALDCKPADISWRAGVDVLCFGGAKNGLGLGEAVLFFDRALARDFEYRCKQSGQLASKMRFLAAPWLGLLESGAWLRNARHGNLCASKLADKIHGLPGVSLAFPVEANAVFLRAPKAVLDALQAKGLALLYFHRWRRALHVRLGRRSRAGGCAGGRYREHQPGVKVTSACRDDPRRS